MFPEGYRVAGGLIVAAGALHKCAHSAAACQLFWGAFCISTGHVTAAMWQASCVMVRHGLVEYKSKRLHARTHACRSGLPTVYVSVCGVSELSSSLCQRSERIFSTH